MIAPAERNSNYTGVIGLDDTNALDASPTREVFIGFDGTTARNMLMIGIVGVVAYLVYKEIKKG